MTGIFVPFGTKRPNSMAGWIEDGSGCHIWAGHRDKRGYGRVKTKGRCALVHRERYEREVGPIPAGLELDHFACNNPSCCNPAHVRPVSRRENALRGETIVAAHAAKTHCVHGHPLVGDNLVQSCLGHRRMCRACHILWVRGTRIKAQAKRSLLHEYRVRVAG